ncbi:partial Anaerobic magnesium-protoporphyrin IX monomethyl ester cyclase, partial [uncultured bacterium]
FIEKTGADVIVIGEGEITVVDLLETLEQKKSLSGVKGIAYMDGNTLVETPRRHLIADVDSIPMPAYKLFQMEYYRLLRFAKCSNTDFVIPMLSGRGCPFKCTFCYRMDKGFRPRKSEGILEEMRLLNRDYGVNYFLFSDDLLMSSVERTMEISEAILSSGMRIKWHCNGRLNYATPDVLKAMKKSGCVFINYGIEAMDDRVLKNMHKALTTKQVIKGIEATISEGISPGLNIIFGNIGDNRDTLNKGVEFLLKYDDGAQMRTIRPVTPYPGSPLYYDAIEKGLLKDCRDFYEHKHLNSDLLSVNFTELSDEDFYDALCEANLRLVDNYYSKKQADIRAQTIHLYHDHDQSFRGFRQT